jgi:Iron-sulfur cluster binding domain of dihydroorotate dehydrogenase B
VTTLARRYDIPVQALVEESMACGIGVCMTCVLPVVGDDGVTRMVRSCVAGPVFRGEAVRWDDIGTIPFDALGAPGWNPRQHAGNSGAAARPAAASPVPGPSRDGSSRAGSPGAGAPPVGASGPAGTPRAAGAGRVAGPGPARREQHGS